MATQTYRPSWSQRWANRVLTQLVRRGKGPAFMRLLTVTGRRTGRPHTTPVVPVQSDGDTWLVSPFGEVDWVRNVRATHRVELRRGDDRTTYEARELGARPRLAVHGRLRRAAPGRHAAEQRTTRRRETRREQLLIRP